MAKWIKGGNNTSGLKILSTSVWTVLGNILLLVMALKHSYTSRTTLCSRTQKGTLGFMQRNTHPSKELPESTMASFTLEGTCTDSRIDSLFILSLLFFLRLPD